MTRKNSRDLTHWIVMLAVGTAVYLIGCHLARAATGPDPTPATGIDWTFWIALVSLGLGLASHVLHYVAPRTKATWDDALRDDVDAMLSWWRNVDPKPALAASQPRDSQAGFISRDLLLWFAVAAVVAVGGGLIATSCTATQARQTAAVGTVAALDCEAQHLTGEALGDLVGLAERTVQGWISGTAPTDIATLRARVKADLALFKTDAGRCAIAGALAALGAVVSRPGEAVSAVGADQTMARAAFALEARAAAWPALQVAGASI